MYEAASYAIGFLITMPLITFLHELGHAIPQLIRGYRVVIQMGNLENAVKLKLGKLYIYGAPFSMFNGFCSISSKGGKNRKVLSLLCGPIFSVVLALCFYWLSFQNLGYWTNFQVNLALYFSAFQAFLTLIPIKYPDFFGGYAGTKSDGLQAFELVKKNGGTS